MNLFHHQTTSIKTTNLTNVVHNQNDAKVSGIFVAIKLLYRYDLSIGHRA